jgi:hypothetical protein
VNIAGYRIRAAECRKGAAVCRDPKAKTDFEAAAHEWDRLAEQAERFGFDTAMPRIVQPGYSLPRRRAHRGPRLSTQVINLIHSVWKRSAGFAVTLVLDRTSRHPSPTPSPVVPRTLVQSSR